MEKIKEIGAEEIYLAPENEKNKNVEEIVQLSLEAKKYPFIIEYTPGLKESVLSELERIGCSVERNMDFANCVAVPMSMIQLEAIKAMEEVELVEKDYEYKILSDAVEAEMMAGDSVEQEFAIEAGKEIKLAVLDTGVSKELQLSIKDAVNLLDDSDGFCDLNGHGTQMIGIIGSVVVDTENQKAIPSVYSITVANHRGFAKTSAIMIALDWAIRNGIKIISMSFGVYQKSNLLEKMVNRAAKCGMVMVAAAGNDGTFEDEQRIMYPAAYADVLSVGAGSGTIAEKYSSGGNRVDCLAPGTRTTVDINGKPVSVIGTSVSAAYVAGSLLKTWCLNPESSVEDVVSSVKNPLSGEETTEAATADIDKISLLTVNEKDDTMKSEIETVSISSGEVSVLCVGGDGNCSSNDMSTAINVPFFSWQTGEICCPGNEVWYKFTTAAGEAHPNGSKGWYGIQTQGSLDTMGYLYDAYGNQIDDDDDGGNNLNFKITYQLEYGKTYYVKVRAYGSNTGSFSIKVDYGRDDHGNSMDTATEIVGVYDQDKSVNGYLHSYTDADYYTFVPARNCVMEIYTEGDTSTYGRLYCSTGALLDADSDSNGNGNFKITAHLEADKRYYIAVSHESPIGYGDYTLRFKFVRDFAYNLDGGSVCWVNDNPDERNELGSKLFNLIFLNEDSGYKYHYEMTKSTVRGNINSLFQDGMNDALTETLCALIGVSSNFILSIGLGLMVQMINSFEKLYEQIAFEQALDQVIENKKGFVFLMNSGHLTDTYATDYAYYDQPYFYGYPQNRGRFYQ